MQVQTRKGRKLEISIHGSHHDDIQCDGAEYTELTRFERIREWFGASILPTDAEVDDAMEYCAGDIAEEWVTDKICEAEYKFGND